MAQTISDETRIRVSNELNIHQREIRIQFLQSIAFITSQVQRLAAPDRAPSWNIHGENPRDYRHWGTHSSSIPVDALLWSSAHLRAGLYAAVRRVLVDCFAERYSSADITHSLAPWLENGEDGVRGPTKFEYKTPKQLYSSTARRVTDNRLHLFYKLIIANVYAMKSRVYYPPRTKNMDALDELPISIRKLPIWQVPSP